MKSQARLIIEHALYLPDWPNFICVTIKEEYGQSDFKL